MSKATNRRVSRSQCICRAEALEHRVVLSTFTVTATGDAGAGSLRQAILDADALSGANTIVFAASFSTSPHTITFITPTPQINGQLTITGPGTSLLTVTRSGTVTASSNVFNSFATSLTMSGMTVTGGDRNADGGGLSISGVNPNVTLDSMVFTSNTANGNGGAIALTNNSTLTIRNSVISNNTASALGGGIFFFQGGSLVMQNCTVSGNTASGVNGHDVSGGGIYFAGTALASPPTGYLAGTLLVQSSTFSGNGASHAGGGIAADAFTGTLLVQNSTFALNTAGTSGGAIWCTGNTATIGSVTVEDCTIASNTASGTGSGAGGGGIARVGSFMGSITLTGSILYGNSGPASAPDILASSFTTTNAFFCAIGSAAGFTLSGISGNNLPFGTNPILGALGNNGGSAQTIPLLPNSPAINAGTAISGITTDQRGIARPQGSAPDIGAYERQATNAQLIGMSYEFQSRQAITFNFSADASVVFSRSSYALQDLTTTQTLPASTGGFSFSPDGSTATLIVTNLLADGNYKVTAGTSTLNFFVLRGDANHDGTVNFADLLVVAQHYNSTGATSSTGDFNYDGKVDFSDLLALRSNYNKNLPASTIGRVE